MKTTGSGWGKLVPTYRLEQPEQFYDGRVVLEHSKQFNAKNVCRVTSGFTGEEGDRAYLLFLDPNDTSRRRQGSDQNFVLWDFQLESGDSIFYAVDE